MLLRLLLTDGGRRGETRHYECRNCGQNLSADAGVCPDCGGEVAVYVF